MIIEDTKKHLTDQEFYTFAKFLKLITEKKEIEGFDFYKIMLGVEEKYDIFSRIFMTAQVAGIPIYIHKYFIEKEIENINKELGELLRIYMIINIKNIKIGYNV
ncbi:MAG: hypothetical protein PHQ01_02595 [Candidatus Pacebacteria bacterium]|jgi:hypothetical protein|nr:hypothetical protein [Candidatus Paceibacterota bacterium]